MDLIFKYKRVLTLIELNYYFNTEDFIKYYNGFINDLELKLSKDFSYDFENCLNYLNSISIIVVEKFLCAYMFYIERGRYSMIDEYSYYDMSILKKYNNQQFSIRAKPSKPIQYTQQTQQIHYQSPYTFCLNEDGSCSLKDTSLFTLLLKIIMTKKYSNPILVSPRDIAGFVNKIGNSQSDKEIEKIMKDFKKIIKFSIPKKYELEDYRRINER